MRSDPIEIHAAISAPSATVDCPQSSVETAAGASLRSDGGDRPGSAGSENDPIRRRVFWELRHARLRLALAENELAWAQELLISGGIVPGDALIILDETMDNLSGAPS